MERLLAVGDIHGMYDKLVSLLDSVQFDEKKDFMIFLGDYIDRGPDSVACLQLVRDLCLKYPENVVALSGNHEEMCMDDLLKSNLLENFDNGLISFEGSFGAAQIAKEKKENPQKYEELLSFLHNLRPYYQKDNFFFAHAGINPEAPFDKQELVDLHWIRSEFYDNYEGDVTIVVGHTPTQAMIAQRNTPIFRKNIILCDTGSFMKNGKISCVDVLSGNFWQSF